MFSYNNDEKNLTFKSGRKDIFLEFFTKDFKNTPVFKEKGFIDYSNSSIANRWAIIWDDTRICFMLGNCSGFLHVETENNPLIMNSLKEAINDWNKFAN